MTLDIVRHRLSNQSLSQTKFTEPGEVIRALGAVQSQDYAGAKWGLGQRMKEATDAALDRDFNEGKILRTHLMRPTWHFVTPEDIRWMLMLTGSRVHTANASMYRQLELDKATLRKGNITLEKTLRDGKQLTRSELASAFVKAGIVADGLRMGYFLMYAELEGLICSGARRGKQFTYTLLEERASQVKAWRREEALAELTRRYFATRGPATLQDFTWWSGLTVADAKAGIEMVKSQFVNEVFEDKSYWFDSSVSPVREKSPSAHLLPNYDEYFIGFKDRSAIGKIINLYNLEANHPTFLAHVIIMDGQLVGGWKKALNRTAVILELHLIPKLTKVENQAVMAATQQYGKFLGIPAQIVNMG